MRGRYLVAIILGVSLVFGAIIYRQFNLSKGFDRSRFEQKKIRILTYSSFAGPSGAGGPLIAQFKKICNCDVEVQMAGDAGIILERLKLLSQNSFFDVVIGLDQMSMPQASELKWRPIKMESGDFVPEVRSYLRNEFIPFDWSYLTFLYREGDVRPPASFLDLLKPEYKGLIAIQDPRTSAPGLLMLQWFYALRGQATRQFLAELKPNVASVSPSWSFSYGLFKKKQASMVFSYVTSLAYHWGIENDMSYRAVVFPEGHPMQVEYVSIPDNCKECELAEKFVSFLLEPSSQKILMEKNFMYPARSLDVEGTAFARLPKLSGIPLPKDAVETYEFLEVFK